MPQWISANLSTGTSVVSPYINGRREVAAGQEKSTRKIYEKNANSNRESTGNETESNFLNKGCDELCDPQESTANSRSSTIVECRPREIERLASDGRAYGKIYASLRNGTLIPSENSTRTCTCLVDHNAAL